MADALFVQTLERPLRYRVTDIGTLRRIARPSTQQGQFDLNFTVDLDDSFCERAAYEEGRLSEAPDLSVYDQVFDDGDEEEDLHG